MSRWERKTVRSRTRKLRTPFPSLIACRVSEESKGRKNERCVPLFLSGFPLFLKFTSFKHTTPISMTEKVEQLGKWEKEKVRDEKDLSPQQHEKVKKGTPLLPCFAQPSHGRRVLWSEGAQVGDNLMERESERSCDKTWNRKWEGREPLLLDMFSYCVFHFSLTLHPSFGMIFSPLHPFFLRPFLHSLLPDILFIFSSIVSHIWRTHLPSFFTDIDPFDLSFSVRSRDVCRRRHPSHQGRLLCPSFSE